MRERGEAVQLYERGGEFDSAGQEAEAIPLYEQAHSAGRDREALRELLEGFADEGEYEQSLRAYAAEI